MHPRHHDPATDPGTRTTASTTADPTAGADGSAGGDDELVELTVGPPAHGGHCVARLDGRVVFVRHALPGEKVLARITERRSKLWRAEAVEVREASPDRVEHVWPEAGPGGVGGGELGHVALPAQRRWKAQVLADTLRRIGSPEALESVRAADGGAQALEAITALPGDEAGDGLGTRTRIDLTVDADRRAGMFVFRSHDVRALRSMPLAAAPLLDLGLFTDPRWRRHWRPGSRIEVVAPSVGDPLVLVDGRGMGPSGPKQRAYVRERVVLERAEGRGGAGAGGEGAGGEPLTFDYRVAADGFWQVHRSAPAALIGEVLAAAQRLGVGAGARVIELYSGAGLLTVPLAALVGESGAVVALEQAPRAIKDARRNLHEHPWARLREAAVTPDSVRAVLGEFGGGQGTGGAAHGGHGGRGADLVVLDPPRAGAGTAVIGAIAQAGAPIVLVSCDPAAFARDVEAARGRGYEVVSVRALDLFPHTHHFEVVATLRREA